MEIVIAPNKIHGNEQRISFDNQRIYTLVGENGSGKSAILETAFKTLLQRSDLNLISFTSGQNECYTSLFAKYLNESKKFLIENYHNRGVSLNSFHFDVSWVRLLIFFATTLKKKGLVRKFLTEKQLIDISDEGFEDDISTNLSFRMRVLKRYTDRLAYDDEQVSKDYEYQSKAIRFSLIHEMIDKLVTHYYREYDFTTSYVLKWHQLSPKTAFDILGKDINQIFTFLGYATNNRFFIDRYDCYLNFKGGIELNDLSDGEFQLLSIYSIVDLFDANNTVFLFDEIDSHLHYLNNTILWNTLNAIEGKVLTTTHSADSIILNNPDCIKLVSKGRIDNEATADHIFKRFELLTENRDFQFRYAAKLPYIALIDNLSDWFIFKELARIKIREFNETKFDKVKPIARSSTGNLKGTDFGKAKLLWIKKMLERSENVLTQTAFLICDRDEFHIDNIRENLTLPIDDQEIKKLRGKKEACFLLSWRRREIENYLLCNTIIENNNLLESIKGDLKHKDLPVAGSNCDNRSIQDLQAKEVIKPLYLKSDLENLEDDIGIDYDKLRSLIAQIPAEEISEDIEKMYNFIVSKIV